MFIELTGIEKEYVTRGNETGFKALNGINLKIDKGEMLAIKGASGAGKSTLLHILGCLDKPTSGQYLLDGQDMTKASSAELSSVRNKKFGFVMQHFALVEEDSVLENVAIPLVFGKTKFSLIDVMALERLRQFGIADLAKQRTSKLSGGEKQRVAIARALVNNPDIILADEPTGALDEGNTAMIMRIFRELNEQGKTIIIVTHEEFVASSCDRVITISDGRVIEE